MELSTRILRSRKKALDLLVKQQIATGALYDKVNSGVAAATDRLVDSLRHAAQLLAATGDIRASLKFYAEAIKYSKKRTGRVTPKEVEMSVEMAVVMIRLKSMRARAKRLLETVLPHAESHGDVRSADNIKSLVKMIDSDLETESLWRSLMHSVSSVKSKFLN